MNFRYAVHNFKFTLVDCCYISNGAKDCSLNAYNFVNLQFVFN